MRADYKAGCLRLQWYPADPYDENNNKFVVIFYDVVTYGDALTALSLELIAREIIAPECAMNLAKDLLQSARYVDDVLASSDNQEELWDAMHEDSRSMLKYDFRIKKIYRNFCGT